ncbi:MED6 mediator sub complex component-domain-containing protein [Leucosporidium creatinivorum]|uniref:Mediator of RNA polymerase II transcription subunit 6 n=1 Tax=Leucosporidium creatinivorum TaxID=106004 RepID=A0A1Y2DA66_9BASI|nr:MED6 mediator sub complex component-domain-containing protein [Leucosporidium creatinivorum]
MATPAPVPPSLSHLQWRATEWLLAFGPLRPEIVMDYFVLSPFFDRTSNNATLRMQMQFSRGGMEGVDEEAELRRFVGAEYAVVHAAPPSLFIIHKRDRTSPTEATTTAAYYILNDNIYQGPSLYTVINERVLTSLHALSSSLTLLRNSKLSWSPESLYSWDIRPPAASAQLDSAVAAAEAAPDALEGERKRPREEGDEEGETVEGGEDDEDTLRPAGAFNPLLFRALQSVAASLPNPPPPPVLPQPPAPPAKKEASVAPSASAEAMEVDEKENEGEGSKEKSTGIRLSASGKRKPKKAA